MIHMIQELFGQTLSDFLAVRKTHKGLFSG
jgi:hypothetical protein